MMTCNQIADQRQILREAYQRPIHHGIEMRANVNASADIGGREIRVNFAVLFPRGNVEIAQTLIHEMMHCAGERHPRRRDPDPDAGESCARPDPTRFDCPFDGGPYYGTPPLQAELCIAGSQSDQLLNANETASQRNCVIDESGVASIYQV